MTRLRRNKYTTDSFKQAILSVVGDEYEVLGEYIKSSQKILMRHKVCNHEWEVIPNNFLNNGTRCPKCYGRNKFLTTQQFRDKIYRLVGDEYSVVGEYTSADSHVTMRHNTCGRVWDVIADFFTIRGTRCPSCNRGKWTLDEFQYELTKKQKDNFTILGEFHGVTNPLLIHDNRCGHEYETTAINLISAQAPKCAVCSKERTDKKNIGAT